MNGEHIQGEQQAERGAAASARPQAPVVVGFDGTPACQYALARARALGGPIVVLTTAGRPERLTLDGVVDVDIRHVPHLHEEVVLDAALGAGARHAVLSDYAHGPVTLLRLAQQAAARRCEADDPVFGVLVTRFRGDSAAGAYRDVLVGTDASPSAGFAALVGGSIAATGARVRIAAIERRRDLAARRLFDRLAVEDPTFSPDEFRALHRRSRHAGLEIALAALDATGRTPDIDFRVGDPSDVLIRASRLGDHDLLVTGMLGHLPTRTSLGAPAVGAGPTPDTTPAHLRHGQVGRQTRRVSRLAPVDTLLVFDAVSAGTVAEADTPHALCAAARCLLGADAAAGAHAAVAQSAPTPA